MIRTLRGQSATLAAAGCALGLAGLWPLVEGRAPNPPLLIMAALLLVLAALARRRRRG